MEIIGIYKRIYNGVCLKYSLQEVFKLIVFKRLFSFINRYRRINKEDFVEINITELHIKIISLKFRNDRRIVLERMMNKNEISFEYIDGIHGQTLNEYECFDFFNKTSFKNLSNGSIGCILSHAKAYKQILINDYDYLLIFEDDVIIEDNFKLQLKIFLKSIPKDFDILYLASNISMTTNMRGWISDSLYIPMYPRSGQYGYIVSNAGARKILKTIFPVKIVAGGIDTLIGRLVSKGLLNAYHAHPNLCKVNIETESNIFNRSKGLKKMHHTEL